MTKPEGPAQEPQHDQDCGCAKCFVAAEGKYAWRIGRKVPINVYEGDRPVCQCQTALDAKKIVAAVNAAMRQVPATPAPSQPAGARECDEEWPRSVEGVVQALAYLHGRATESGAGASMNLLPIPTAIYWLRELKQQTAAKDEEITRLTAFVSGDGEPDVMAAMWMADRAALPNGDTRDRFIEEARRLFRLNRTAQSDREAAERERDSLREANARLAADLDAALKAGKDGRK